MNMDLARKLSASAKCEPGLMKEPFRKIGFMAHGPMAETPIHFAGLGIQQRSSLAAQLCDFVCRKNLLHYGVSVAV